MIKTHDKTGLVLYITWIPDCGENKGGLYCETYLDECCDQKIDDFCIHPEDCDCNDDQAVENYVRHFYDDETFNLTQDFDGAPIDPENVKYEKV